MVPYFHTYKNKSMMQTPATFENTCYLPDQSNDCEFAESEQQQNVNYHKPAQQPDGNTTSYECSAPPSANIPKFGKVIPNRVFVGGIDFKTTEEDLEKFFLAFGRITSTKVVRDRAEISKGFGFVTFESVDEADRVREQEDCLYLNGKKLNIGPAIEKHQTNFPKDIHIPGPLGSWVLHPGGYASYTHQNGITYFPPALSTPPSVPQQQQTFNQAQAMAYSSTVPYPPTPLYSNVHYPSHNSQYYGHCYPCHQPVGSHFSAVAPPLQHSAQDPMNYIHVGSYIPPRLPQPTNQRILQQVEIRSQAVAPEQVENPLRNMSNSEEVRMVMPSSAHLQNPVRTASFLHAPPGTLPAPLNCGPFVQYIGIPDCTPNYDVIYDDVRVTSENNILTPPLTPEQQQSKQ